MAAQEPASPRGARLRLAAWGVAYHALAFAYLRLTPAEFLRAIGPDPGDPLFNLSILRWVAESARHGFADLWNPTFFHPIRGALALSDHLIGPGLLVGLFELIGLTPAATYNALLLLAFGCTALAAHYVFERCGLRPFAAAMGALLWSFSTVRWAALSHVQVLFAPFVPLTLWSFSRLLDRPEPRAGLLFGACYLGNLLGGSYLAYMTHLPLAALAVSRIATRGIDLSSPKARRTLGVAVFFMAVAVALLFGPYLTIGKTMGLKPRISDLSGFMVTTESLVTVTPRAIHAALFPESRVSERGLWPGFLLLLLGVAGAWRYGCADRRDRWRRTAIAAGMAAVAFLALRVSELRFLAYGLIGEAAQRDARALFRATMLVTILGLWLMARTLSSRDRGEFESPPHDSWWRGLLWSGVCCILIAHVAFFVILRGAVPGMEAIRDPARFLIFAGFSAAAFAARAVDEWLRRTKRPTLLAAGLLAGVLVECTPRSAFLEWRPVPLELSPEYLWIRSDASVRAIVELPLRETWREAGRMYSWSLHRKPMVNGYSGYLPPHYLHLIESIGTIPDREATRTLRELGVTHVVVHRDELDRSQRKRWLRWRSKLGSARDPWLVRVREVGEAEIYALPDEAALTPRSRPPRAGRASGGSARRGGS